MRALYKVPAEPGFRQIIVPNELKPLRELVGGYLESVTLATDACLLCNENGRLEGMAPNCNYLGIDMVGPFLLVGVDGDEWTDCPWSVTIANKGIGPFRGDVK